MRRMLKYLLAALWIAAVVALLTTASAEPDKADCPISSEHDWKLVHEDSPTCDSGGARYWECDNCGTQITETIPELGHDYQYETQAATCTETGYTRNRCTRCGNIFDQIDVPALGHDWDGGVVTTAATCTTDGVRTYTCTRCKDTRTESIPATGHDAVGLLPISPTCTTAGKTSGTICSVCGEILKAQEDDPPLGHNWDGGNYTAPTCTTDGSSIFTCTRCGETRTEIFPATGHVWSSGMVITPCTCTTDGEQVFTCNNNCGETRTESLPATGHNLIPIPASAATCTKAGKTEGKLCTLCGTEVEKQQDIPALGHSWDGGTVTTAATCTTAGVKTYTCSRCGDDRTEAIPATGHTAVTLPAVAATCTTGGKTEGSQCSACGAVLTIPQDTAALGHNWDEGKVTKEAGYLEAGEITYTCKRDASHTKTEATPLKEVPGEYSDVMSMLRKDPTDGEGETLTIVVQPAGGVLKDGFTLSVEAAGGTEPYTYVWYRLNGHESITGAAAAKEFDWLGSRAEARYGKVLAAAGRLAKLNTGNREILEGAVPETTVSVKAFSDRVGDNSPDYTPDQPGTYYCVVTDDAENAVTSIRVSVSVPLYISEHPKNANKHGNDAVYLRCVAAGGEPAEDGTYTYSWYQNGDVPVFLAKNATGRVQVFETGDYFCVVRDNAGGSQTSLLAQVYDTKLLTARVVNDFMPFIPDVPSGPFMLTVSGGVPPYECACTYDGVTETKAMDGTNACEWDSSRPGTYTFTVTDSMGETVTAAAKADYMPLQFEQQPEGGKLPADGNGIDLQVTISEFEEYPPVAPFTWTLYRDGVAYMDGISETRKITAKPGEPGAYMFHVEDSGGRKGDTVIATVEDSEIQIVRIDVDGVWKREGDTVQLMVITEGNIALAYRWYWLGTEKAIDAPVVGEEVICDAERPGKYMVRVEDVNHKFAWGYCTVEYTGAEPLNPFIIEQPKDWVWMEEDTSREVRKVTLHCKATGEHLLYNWMKEGGDWLPIGGGETLEMTGTQQELKGRYYCIVYDFDTGKETRSDTVYVQVKLSCEINGLDGDYLIWSVHGGFGHWKVKIYDGTYLEDWDTCYDGATTNRRTKVKPYEKIPYYDKEIGRWVLTKVEKHFHLVVTDRYGQTCESGVY